MNEYDFIFNKEKPEDREMTLIDFTFNTGLTKKERDDLWLLKEKSKPNIFMRLLNVISFLILALTWFPVIGIICLHAGLLILAMQYILGIDNDATIDILLNIVLFPFKKLDIF